MEEEAEIEEARRVVAVAINVEEEVLADNKIK
jgi:hypothetical protein